VDADDTSFGSVVKEASLPVLVDVWAPWCGPCRQIAPVVEQLSRDLAGRLKVAKVNADVAPGVSGQHGITGIPTLLLYRNGQEVDRLVGAAPPPRLRAWVEAALAG